MLTHYNDFWHDLDLRPLYTEHFRQLLEVDSGSFPDAVYVVSQPGHAKVSKLFIEEGFSELGREEGDVLDDGLSDAPGLVLSQLDNGREKALRQKFDTNHCGMKGED